MSMRMPDDKGSLDEENFYEAKRAIIRSVVRTRIPDNVKAVLENAKASILAQIPSQNGHLTRENATTFWIFAGTERFLDMEHFLKARSAFKAYGDDFA